MREDEADEAIARLALVKEAACTRIVKSLTPSQARELNERWPRWAHEGQLPPEDEEWRVWLLMAGRGFGKTRAGAEWVSALARLDGSLRIALVGATYAEAVKVMVEGESGLLAVAREDEEVRWIQSAGLLTFASGARAFVYSGEAPETLRGPEHHFAWCDELAKWRYAQVCWDNLMLGLRLGTRPRALVTTTPRPIPLLKQLIGAGGTARTGGRTQDNPNLPKAFRAAMTEAYGGTRLGRQELEGQLIEDVEGALWTRDLIERQRAAGGHLAENQGGLLRRVVVGVDPPGSAAGDACGIVVAGLGSDGIGYVLADRSVRGLSPEGWAGAVARAAETYDADRVVAEKNMGGDMVESVLRSADVRLPVKAVSASRGKVARAEPVAALFEKDKARFAGAFPELEDELAGLTAGGRYEGPGRSPDRADAMVWALTELMLGRARAEPRVSLY